MPDEARIPSGKKIHKSHSHTPIHTRQTHVVLVESRSCRDAASAQAKKPKSSLKKGVSWRSPPYRRRFVVEKRQQQQKQHKKSTTPMVSPRQSQTRRAVDVVVDPLSKCNVTRVYCMLVGAHELFGARPSIF